jgi:hypothetical protein
VFDAVASDELNQLAGDLAHWRAAAHHLGELDTIAAPAAWAALERYVGEQIRLRLGGIAASLSVESDQLAAAMSGGRFVDLARLRDRVLDFRRRYLQAETVIAFYAAAVNHRTTPRLSSLLRGLDSLAVDSMQVVLRPMGVEAPPVLTYAGEGLGASIVKYGVRLWDRTALSPVAAIRIAEHQLLTCPTSFTHETGHQVAHLLGWNDELASALFETVSRQSPAAADAWRQWASEVAADVHAFVLLGYGPVRALANVVDGTTDQVFNMPFGDPHPFGWLRVLFNVALCRLWYGNGPWDRLAATWIARHPVELAPADAQHVARVSLDLLPRLAAVCTQRPMRAFGGRPLYQLADPRRASPPELAALARRAGESLYTSTYLQRQESLRILGWNSLQLATSPERAPELSQQLEAWLVRMGTEPVALAA